MYERFENQISKLVYAMLAKNVEDYEEVSYPDQFDVTALSDEITDSFTMMERNFSPIFNKVLQKNMVRKAIPTAPQSIRQDIENEIESGTGILEPIVKANPLSSGDDGSGNPNSNIGDTTRTSTDLEKEEVGKQAKEK
jgi:hypothetical protein